MSEPASISLGIAARYASALFDLAKEDGALKALEADATALTETLAASEDLRAVIASPVIRRAEQGKVIAAAFVDAFNQMVRSLRNYRAQSVQGQGLGGGGRLGVDGGAAPRQTYTPENAPPPPAPARSQRRR